MPVDLFAIIARYCDDPTYHHFISALKSLNIDPTNVYDVRSLRILTRYMGNERAVFSIAQRTNLHNNYIICICEYINIDNYKLIIDYINSKHREYLDYAFTCSAAYGILDAVNYCLERGANMNKVGQQYSSALYVAAFYGHLEIVKLLIQRGADPYAAKGNWNVVVSAADGGQLEIIKYLDALGVDLHISHDYALIKAAEGGHIDTVIYLLDRGLKFATRERPFQFTTLRSTMRGAAKRGHVDYLKYFIENKHYGDIPEWRKLLDIASDYPRLKRCECVVEYLKSKLNE